MRRWTGLLLTLLAVVCNAHAFQVNILWQRVGLQDSSGYGGPRSRWGTRTMTAMPTGPSMPRTHRFRGPADSDYVEFFHGGNPPATEPYLTYTARATAGGELGGAWPIGDINGDHLPRLGGPGCPYWNPLRLV